MINIEDVKRTTVAVIGAFILTTAAVGAAVGPARAVETAPISYAGVQASDRAYA